MTLRPQPENLKCLKAGCSADTCCLVGEDPCAPTKPGGKPPPGNLCGTSTPQPAAKVTCAGFTCSPGHTLRPQPERLDCLHGSCSDDSCCLLPNPAPASLDDPCAPMGPKKIQPIGPEPCGTTTPLPPIANCACVNGFLPCTPYQCAGEHYQLVVHPATVRCFNHKGCTTKDHSHCCKYVVTTTTTTAAVYVPGVVIADRICLLMEGCNGCDNECDCFTNSGPFNVQNTNVAPVKRDIHWISPYPPKCHDNWLETLLIGAFAAIFTFMFTTIAYTKCIAEMFKREEDSGYKTKRLTEADPMVSMTSMSAGGLAMQSSAAMGGTAADTQGADRERIEYVGVNMSHHFLCCVFLDLVMVGVVSFLTVYAFGFLIDFIWQEVQGCETPYTNRADVPWKYRPECSTAIRLLDYRYEWPFMLACPTALLGLVVAVWSVTFWAHLRLWIFKRKKLETKSKSFVQAMTFGEAKGQLGPGGLLLSTGLREGGGGGMMMSGGFGSAGGGGGGRHPGVGAYESTGGSLGSMAFAQAEGYAPGAVQHRGAGNCAMM